jgi:non-specific serine/threonine protein kinase/serine/threonine-protein kinase
MTATGVAFWQWRVARAEQARAEQRFGEVRRLANAVIFKIQEAVAPLPGSTPVRRLIVDEAIGYLERLDAESGDDPTLRIELAGAHRQIGNILGLVGSANLGDREGALKQFNRARELMRPLLAGTPPFEAVLAYVDASIASGTIHASAGRTAEGLARAREAIEVINAYRQRRPDETRAAELQARCYFNLAIRVPSNEAIPVWIQTLDYYEKLLSLRPDDFNTQRNVALVGKYLGAIYERTDQKLALQHYTRSLELDQKRLAASPEDQRVWFDAAISFSNVASILDVVGDHAGAEPLFMRSLELRERLTKLDPKNVAATDRLGYLLARLGRFYLPRDPERSRDFSRRSLDVLQPLVEQTGDHSLHQQFARGWYQIALAEQKLNSPTRACDAFRRADGYFKLIRPSLRPVDDGALVANADRTAQEVSACGR